jgi:lactobin A/cerein 7B family class IIb bacteriocin
MRYLSEEEVAEVGGGFVTAVTVVIAVVAAGAYLGEKMAERDNRASAQQE